VAHYYRFQEIHLDKLLTRAATPPGFTFGPEAFGVNWCGIHPAIADPGQHDFSREPDAARAAQAACNAAYTTLIDELQQGVSGQPDRLGNAVRAMFDLRMAARVALITPLADQGKVAGPAFLYTPAGRGGLA